MLCVDVRRDAIFPVYVVLGWVASLLLAGVQTIAQRSFQRASPMKQISHEGETTQDKLQGSKWRRKWFVTKMCVNYILSNHFWVKGHEPKPGSSQTFFFKLEVSLVGLHYEPSTGIARPGKSHPSWTCSDQIDQIIPLRIALLFQKKTRSFGPYIFNIHV